MFHSSSDNYNKPALKLLHLGLPSQLERLSEKKEALESEYGRRVAHEDGAMNAPPPASAPGKDPARQYRSAFSEWSICTRINMLVECIFKLLKSAC